MRILTVLEFAFLGGVMAVAGCSQPTPKKSAADVYDIQGKIEAIRPDKTGVTLDHEDIPGLMKGMKMGFPVKDAKVLDGLQVGDQVQGRLQVESGKYLITELKKR
jgi:Cu/Ag efflux protein CusF